MVLAEKIKKMFHEEGIHSTTIQPEFVEFEDDDASASLDSVEDCILDCPSKDKEGCVANTCCGPSKQVTSVPKALSTSIPQADGITGVQFQRKSSLSLPDITQRTASPLEGVPPNWTTPDITILPSGTAERLPGTHSSSSVVLTVQGLDQSLPHRGGDQEGSQGGDGVTITHTNVESHSGGNATSEHDRMAGVPLSHTVVIEDAHVDNSQ